MDTKVDGKLATEDVVIDLEAYPRAEWSGATIDRYAEALEAGQRLPPITVERDTNRLLDGMHRYRAHLKLGLESIEVDCDEVPEGVPVKLYAASLSAKHGDRISGADLKEVARDTIHANPDFSMRTVARMLGVTRQTVGRWVGDITERRREVRRVKALILSRAGWSNVDIAEELGVTEGAIRNDVTSNISTNLTEDLLREASEDLPDEFTETIVKIREELIFASWSEAEHNLLDAIRNGETIIVNMSGTRFARGMGTGPHVSLVHWLADTDQLMRIDRASKWGNPFEIPDDGDRNTVILKYEKHYLPHKPLLLEKLPSLNGKALACWCAPDDCHGRILAEWAERGDV